MLTSGIREPLSFSPKPSPNPRGIPIIARIASTIRATQTQNLHPGEWTCKDNIIHDKLVYDLYTHMQFTAKMYVQYCT